MAELCVKILHHITKNEIRQVFPLSDELRSVRAGLSEFLESRLEAYKDFIPASSMDYKLIEQLKLGVGIVRKFDHFHGQWLNAIAEPDIDELENATIEQWHIVLEKRFPHGWDCKKDLLVIYGLIPENLNLAISERLQERVLVYAPTASTQHGPVTEDRNLRATIRKEHAEAYSAKTNFPTATEISKLKGLFPIKDPPKLITELKALSAPNDEELKNAQKELDSLQLVGTVSKNTTTKFGPLWFNQGLVNIPKIARSQPLVELSGLFRGLPLIIVSPGPSLEKNIHGLKQAVGKAVFMAPAQSMKRLHREGIYPDFIVVIDPQDYTSEEIGFFDPAIIQPHQALIVGATCHPNVINLPFTRRYFFASTAAASWITALFGDKNLNTTGTSVSVAATNIGLEWECNPIILVGQDLAYSEGIQYAGKDTGRSKHDAIFELEGYFGGKVMTPYTYKVAHYEFELIAERLSTSEAPIDLINATEGGARIRGFKQIPLLEVISRNLSENAGVSGALALAIEATSKYDFNGRVSMGLKKLVDLTKTVKRLRESAIHSKQLYLSLNQSATQQKLAKLEKEERKLRLYLKSLYFLELIMANELGQVRSGLSRQSDAGANLEISTKFFDIIVRACDTIEAKLPKNF